MGNMDRILEMLDEIEPMIKHIGKAMSLEEESHNVAEKAIDQLDSLTVDDWIASGKTRSPSDSMENLNKIFKNGQDDVIIYGKAVGIVNHHMKHRFDRANQSYKTRFRRFFNKDFARHVDHMDEGFTNAAVYFVLKRFKEDIMDRYELTEKTDKKPEAKK